ncbi:MAG: hypothetical protein LBR13_02695, partial [Dysgonamonadaceae bacterium]|nr:hypothetical protein [Dysgonamonadaceae bacterium]
MRKTVAILTVFAANIMMLAHTFIPHHHHHGVPHFDFAFTVENHEDEDCHHDESSCILEQDFDVIYEDTKDDSATDCN